MPSLHPIRLTLTLHSQILSIIETLFRFSFGSELGDARLIGSESAASPLALLESYWDYVEWGLIHPQDLLDPIIVECSYDHASQAQAHAL